MLFLLNNSKKNEAKPMDTARNEMLLRVKEAFINGRFPVVTTDSIQDKKIEKVLGLVACRGFDPDEAFYGMATRAVKKGAMGIIGYRENVAFHPDGSKFHSCIGTAVQFERPGRKQRGRAQATQATRVDQEA